MTSYFYRHVAKTHRNVFFLLKSVANFQESVEKIAHGKEWYAKEYSKCNPKFISDAMLKEFCQIHLTSSSFKR